MRTTKIQFEIIKTKVSCNTFLLAVKRLSSKYGAGRQSIYGTHGRHLVPTRLNRLSASALVILDTGSNVTAKYSMLIRHGLYLARESVYVFSGQRRSKRINNYPCAFCLLVWLVIRNIYIYMPI